MGDGLDNCAIHGKDYIDWKCMYCCDVALFRCFGTHTMCNRCHDEYNRTCNPTLKDCGGVNCPLGIHHPPASSDYKKGVYPLGCSICRSEKLKKGKGHICGSEKNESEVKKVKIVRPEVDIEFPQVVLEADEQNEAQLLKDYWARARSLIVWPTEEIEYPAFMQ